MLPVHFSGFLIHIVYCTAHSTSYLAALVGCICLDSTTSFLASASLWWQSLVDHHGSLFDLGNATKAACCIPCTFLAVGHELAISLSFFAKGARPIGPDACPASSIVGTNNMPCRVFARLLCFAKRPALLLLVRRLISDLISDPCKLCTYSNSGGVHQLHVFHGGALLPIVPLGRVEGGMSVSTHCHS